MNGSEITSILADTLHYLLSTIPQVLAALIALLGVFWVYKIAELNNLLKSQGNVAKREVDEKDEAKAAFVSRLYKFLIEKKNYTEKDCCRLVYRFDSTIEQENFKWIYDTICDIAEAEENEIINSAKQKIEKIDQEKKELTTSTISILKNSGIVIGISIICLLLVPIIMHSKFTSWTVLILNTLFLVYVIGASIRVIVRTLKIHNHIN